MNTDINKAMRCDNESLLTTQQGSMLNNLQTSAAQALSQCVESIQILLNKRGIFPPPAIELSMTLEGYLAVGEKRVDQIKIEDILNGHSQILAQYQEAEVLHRMLYAITPTNKNNNVLFHIGITSLGGIAFFTEMH